ncbi:hypothetical protein [Jannaschia rubra]|uniref:Uncharacterized protein n=1 Tax=Jannaschia rubra TaxID=282197 RepID=A0A0M6XTB0_9RHOB|nr:hypothetical protein [Jannaschia rubra]CTQ33942.1 hypothetical protein JAN5088_02731 [Jannaschia rubra]SFG76648.1 hypothetical protein SAMN04488517_11444 [Jannaschia rubra]
MGPNYLTGSWVAWISIVLIVGGLLFTFIVPVAGLAIGLVPVGYFAALIGAAFLFGGWVRWRAAHRPPNR